ncbi:ABC transporter permease [Pseudomonas sp. Leaf59]|uniref:ABC transporter permease n=1 Tax=Pseudomonas sp. Leaf59 TaxID=2876556 RepID=UPI001E40698D|nr:ABC transporter permease [Pseudomonas sp. Leaf59]
MKRLPVIFTHQLTRYACSPSTYLSAAVFLVLCAGLGLQLGQWLERDSSDLQVFFQFHPWLYLLLIPALSIQLWSDEHDVGFRTLIKTLPITPFECVFGKFLAAWLVCAIVLMLMLPIVLIANHLGEADNSVIRSQFLSSWLLAGSYLSAACFICTLIRQQVVIFLLTIGLLLTVSGLYSVIEALDHQMPIWVIDSLISLDPLSRFDTIDNGKLTLSDSLFFISMILAFLSASTVTLNYKSR